MVIAKTVRMQERFQAAIVWLALIASLMNIQMEPPAKPVKLVRFLIQTALDVKNVRQAKLLPMATVNRAQMEKFPILIKQFV